MARIVLLDAGPLGYLTHPDPQPPERERQCREWATDIRRKGTILRITESADYEVRRSLIRNINSGPSIAQLDELINIFGGILSVTTDVWRCASELWATARFSGMNPSRNERLDFDVLLAAHARVLERNGEDAWVATDNISDLRLLYHKSSLWEEITPAGQD
jgi:hypothetical protein